MKGTMLTIRSNSPKALVQELNEYPDVEVLHDAVGGWLEIVPYFDTIIWDGELHQCLAFCDEEGKVKGKPFNVKATVFWRLALERAGRASIVSVGNFLEIRPMGDHLVGDIVVIWGDQEFMYQLMNGGYDEEMEEEE